MSSVVDLATAVARLVRLAWLTCAMQETPMLFIRRPRVREHGAKVKDLASFLVGDKQTTLADSVHSCLVVKPQRSSNPLACSLNVPETSAPQGIQSRAFWAWHVFLFNPPLSMTCNSAQNVNTSTCRKSVASVVLGWVRRQTRTWSDGNGKPCWNPA
jgi:hypothetical protein